MSQDFLKVKGAKEQNLKNVSLDIPKNKFIVITGLSGSGKSSLAFDTIYAEGQRRYVESLSAYARQFLGQMEKPDVESIEGLSPAIAIDQKTSSRSPRSTVGTKTEIYDYLKLLFARIGKTYSPKSNKIVKKDSTSDVVDYIVNQKAKSKLLLLASVESSSKKISQKKLEILKKQGFVRIFKDNEIINITDVENKEIIDFNKKFNWNMDIQKPSASNMGDIAYKKFELNDFEDIAYCEPKYLKEFKTNNV